VGLYIAAGLHPDISLNHFVFFFFFVIPVFQIRWGQHYSQDIIMASTVSHRQVPAQSHDPLGTLATAIGSVLTMGAGKKQSSTRSMSFQVSQALHEILDAQTPQSRSTRMLLIRHLVDVESQQLGLETSRKAGATDDLISTAQAAELLGYSRPYVAMLIDQKKLVGATVSAGGHRRVSRAAVLAWKEKHQVEIEPSDIRTQGQEIGAYKSTEADAVRRVKALAMAAKKA
jgi:excisionase family DNA binding protein